LQSGYEHIVKPRKRERNDRPDQKRDADNQLAFVNLVVRTVDHREDEKEREQQHKQRSEDWMPDPALDRTAQSDHGRQP
jgi:hypothetical protein